MNEIKEP
ncbi:unnamed protein product [Callosobruchus maculatus]|nr:unnamed protein product [Callosobruchus maculatus]